MNDFIAIGVIILVSCFAQSMTGFGLAIVGMPLLRLLGVPIIMAAPFISLVALSMRPLMLWHYWKDFHFRDVWRLVFASIVGIPLGVWGVRLLDEQFVSAVMGLVLIAYALYNAFGERLRGNAEHLAIHEFWAYPLGFISGVLGGAYNIFGPPVVIYASARQWNKETFKANLQAAALMISIVTSVIHTVGGNVTPDILVLLLIGVPSAMLGMVAGFWLDPYINRARFSQIITAFTLFMGVSLLL